MFRSRAAVPLTGLLLTALLGCSAATAATAPAEAAARAGTPAPAAPSPSPSPSPPPVNRETATASLTIPAIGIKNLRVVPYEGTTDDRPGTRIQDRAQVATPYGPHGGVGPGEIGNYLLTAHRLSAGGPFNKVPDLHKGDKVLVTAGGTTYTYTITGTRETDFRSAASLAGQRAAVPGHPGEKPTRAMVTVSTCATPEDNAAGNYWRDALDNPQHRIDKIGVLTSWTKSPAG